MAGISIAIRLAKKGRRVLLLEGGGLEYDAKSQQLYEGDSVGRSYFELDHARLRFLGGTSNHWEGWCRPLDDIDFRELPHKPMSGWPITAGDLRLHLRDVCDIFEIDAEFSDVALPAPSNDLNSIILQLSTPPVLFGEKYLREIQESEYIDLFVNANLRNIKIDEVNGRVSEFNVVNYKNPNEFWNFRARYFVLAMGGLENPRIMLASRSQVDKGIGNANDLVGRCFCEHFHVLGGFYAAESAQWPFMGTKEEIHLSPTSTFQERAEIGNARVELLPLNPELGGDMKERVRPLLCYNDVVSDFVRVFKSLECNIRPASGGYIHVVSEQAPNRNSRVTLTNKTDALGMPIIALDWQTLDIDRKTIVESVKAVGRYLATNDFGNIKLADWIIKENEPIPGVAESSWLGAGWHHMGTTRMSSSPKTGVVDRDLRVFGHDNLFIAGSSVFPTAGHANPSFSMLQLALRLSDHLDRLLAA